MEDIKITQKNVLVIKELMSCVPNSWDTSPFFLDYVSSNLSKYFSLLKKLDGYVLSKVLEHQEIAHCLCKGLIDVIASYLRGNIPLAYTRMGEVYSCISEILIRKSSRPRATGLEFGFKARVILPNDPRPTRNDMFHIPFELRHIVQNHRYSIHGIPSIYLGRSIYDCYLELGKPPLENLWVSLFCFSQDKEDPLSPKHINLIDLTIFDDIHNLNVLTYHSFKKEKEYQDALDSLVDDILLWPLVMACTIACRYPDGKFKQEYIIPQMLYQLCSDYNEYVGIKYLSTKSPCNAGTPKHVMVNYALPAQDVKRDGYCPKLKAQLIMTEPITIKEGLDINTSQSFTTNGLPILSYHKDLKEDETILALDKMTVYFDRLMQSFRKEKKHKLLCPLDNWSKE